MAHDIWKEVADLDIKEKVHDRDEVERDGEGLPRLSKCIKSTLIGRALIQVNPLRGDNPRDDHKGGGNYSGYGGVDDKRVEGARVEAGELEGPAHLCSNDVIPLDKVPLGWGP